MTPTREMSLAGSVWRLFPQLPPRQKQETLRCKAQVRGHRVPTPGHDVIRTVVLVIWRRHVNVIEFIESHQSEYLEELKDFLRIPSVSAKDEHKKDMARAASWLAERLRAAGIKNVKIVQTPDHPLVYAESVRLPDRPTILLYGHYDVQPAEPLELWTSPPFDPTVRDGNLYARGSADDKGQLHLHLKALEALYETEGELPINVKVIIEGEEEIGSKNLWDFVLENRHTLSADALVLSDTSMLARGVPAITYGLRGLNYYQVEVTGPSQDLHSGEPYAREGTLLTRSTAELCENVRDFVVAEEGGTILGCGALHFYGTHLAEIRSILVPSQSKGRGIGRILAEALLRECRRHSVRCVCLFTRTPSFFALGF